MAEEKKKPAPKKKAPAKKAAPKKAAAKKIQTYVPKLKTDYKELVSPSWLKDLNTKM